MSGIFMVGGAGLFVLACRQFARRLAFVRNSAAAVGAVVSLRRERDGMDTQNCLFPLIRFQTASGRTITFESRMGRSDDAWHIGDRVPVRYRVDRPELAELEGFLALWFSTLILLVLATVLAGLAVGLWLGVIPAGT